jgi:hypothetical protein
MYKALLAARYDLSMDTNKTNWTISTWWTCPRLGPSAALFVTSEIHNVHLFLRRVILGLAAITVNIVASLASGCCHVEMEIHSIVPPS